MHKGTGKGYRHTVISIRAQAKGYRERAQANDVYCTGERNSMKEECANPGGASSMP